MSKTSGSLAASLSLRRHAHGPLGEKWKHFRSSEVVL